jgi:hypothetical protein
MNTTITKQTDLSISKRRMVMNRKKLIGTSILLGLIVAVPRAFAQTSNPGVFPPDAVVFGKTYGEWSAKRWQWNFSRPIPSNPTFDTTGQHCHVQQSRPVFFLAGIATGVPVTRECTVPSEKPLFFPIINAECSDVEPPPFFGATAADRLACAQAFIDDVGINTLKATIDGMDVKSLRRFRVQSPDFHFRMPAHNNILFLDGVISGRSVSDGYWLLLEPLSPGNHVIHFEGALVSGPFAGFKQDVTYNLIVR